MNGQQKSMKTQHYFSRFPSANFCWHFDFTRFTYYTMFYMIFLLVISNSDIIVITRL